MFPVADRMRWLLAETDVATKTELTTAKEREQRRQWNRDRVTEAIENCRKLGYTRQEIAQAAGVDTTALSKWVTQGRVQIRSDDEKGDGSAFERFADALGLNVDDLFKAGPLRYKVGRTPGKLLKPPRKPRQPSSFAAAASPSEAATPVESAPIMSAYRQELHRILDALLDSPRHAGTVDQLLRSLELTIGSG